MKRETQVSEKIMVQSPADAHKQLNINISPSKNLIGILPGTADLPCKPYDGTSA